MKVARLEIDNFRHLEDLTFDFTYQSGPKKGQLLSKICFIGQSATGKTSLLELVKEFVEKRAGIDFDARILFDLDNDKKKITFFKQGYDNYGFDDKELLKHLVEDPILYFSSDQLSNHNFNNITKSSRLAENEEILLFDGKARSFKSGFNDPVKNKIIEFNYETESSIWDFILKEISQYREKLTQKGSDLINKGMHLDFKRLGTEMEKWKKENPNPLSDLSEKCLNPILKKINLEVDLADTSSFIPLKPINSDKAIPANALSTGTKQLMLNSLPLYKFKAENSIIIIDEPERSLFPDVQMELIPFYQSLAPKAQFIVATHSPFIAASFEPEERFILYFDEKGKVQVRNGVSPIGDDPNDILKNDFGIEHLMNAFGIKAYKEYLDLKQKMASETDDAKKKELLKEVVSLGDKYKF
jgi:ABC-type lipoprotein export system ATPase subunit